MKIRCKNCYKILNPNEEYCTSCGEYSDKMHNAMITGDYGPDNLGKFKLAFGIYAIAGFLICGILQVVFAIIQTKELGNSTQRFCQSNSLFFSSLAMIVFSLIIFRKDLKYFAPKQNANQMLGGALIGLLVIAIAILISNLFSFTQVLPKFIVNYLKESPKFFDIKNECVFKILVGTILATVSLEIVRKYLVDAFDDTLLGDKSIYIFTTLIMTVLEVAWIMSLDIAIVALIINLATTGIYMLTNRNIVINVTIRFILYFVTVLLLIL